MKYCACVVFYNPSLDNVKNIESYPSYIEKVFVIDNSSKDNSELLKQISRKVEYVPLMENKGIAFALKRACSKALEGKYDYILTMDQDSKFPTNKEDNIKKYLEDAEIFENYSILGVNFEPVECEEKVVDVPHWITSGNFINLKFYKEINGFREELFIDYVDFDLCEQFSRIKKKIGYLPNISLEHTIGNPIHKRFLWKKFTCMNHSPIRYYYRYRNGLYLYKENKKFYKKLYRHDRIIDYWKLILFEPNKKAKLNMIKQGRKDAKKGILGPYKGDK